MEELVAWASQHSWWIYVTTAVTIASALSAVLPSTVKESAAWNVFMKVVNMLGLNVGKAKAADDKTEIKVVNK